MKTKKLNCIRARSRRWLPRAGGLLVLLLTAVLLITPALADSGVIPRATLANKPEVTIRGNVVVDDNDVPTGFYELALCVKSPMRIYGPDPATFGGTIGYKELTEAEYAQVLAEINETDPTLTPTAAQTAGIQETDYTITYYPFSAVSAVVGVNADVLTAVNWDVAQVVYSEWDDTNKKYKGEDPDVMKVPYPRGVDVAANTDPAEWSDTDPDPFPDMSAVDSSKLGRNPVALDAEGDRSVSTAAAEVVGYYKNSDTNTKAALISLSAHAPDNKPVVYTKSTPVVVIRFSYDLKRFPKGIVMLNNDSKAYNSGHYDNQLTGDNATNTGGFWLGLDRGTGHLLKDGKTPLTWLADTDMKVATAFDFSDERAAETESGQVVWTKLGNASGGTDWDYTEYYYYLGASAAGSDAEKVDGSVEVATPAGIQTVPHIQIPKTKGVKILGHGTEENPAPDTSVDPAWTDKAPYSYYSNLLYLDGNGYNLKLRLVNDKTFRAPRGKGLGGNQILFYDWDDTLIGALIVGDGDVRKDVNDYVEKNLVHPDLRAGDVLATDLGGIMPDFTTVTPGSGGKDEEYMNLISSIDREFTYRGQYDSIPAGGAGSVSYSEDPTDPSYDADLVGSDYPLTNKLDYVFYKHLNTVTTIETENATGKTWTEKYFTLTPLTDDPVAAQYPWVYGWAVVEDAANTKMKNKAGWPVMTDAKKIESTWTTFGAGELKTANPGSGNVNSAFATPVASTTAKVAYPGGLDTDWSTDPNRDPYTSGGPNVGYTFMTSSISDNGYLRFADFSDMSALLKPGQDVLVVKAVYEQGTSLLPDAHYTVIDGSQHVERYSQAASVDAATYSFQFQFQRANDVTGSIQGVRRVRDPKVQTSMAYDLESVGGDYKDSKAFYLQNVAANKDIMDIDLTAGGDFWRIQYRLVDLYGGMNIATGEQRSEMGSDFKKNFDYEGGYEYDERLGTDGFVVQATLNTLCAEATKEAWEAGSGKLSANFTRNTVRDLNFRSDMDTQAEFTAGNYTSCATYLQNLIKNIVDSGITKDSDGNDIYDPLTGYVVLGWHQVQREIINQRSGKTSIFSGGILKSDKACEGFPWCRLDNCGENMSLDIQDVNGLLEAIRLSTDGATADEKKKGDDAITNLLKPENKSIIQAMGFRSTGEGVPYDTSSANYAQTVVNDIKSVYAQLKANGVAGATDLTATSWDMIQEIIATGTYPAGGTITGDYWWKNNTPPTVTSWSDLWKYSINATLGVGGDPTKKVPDVFDGFNNTALNRLVSEKPGTDPFTNVGWFRTGVVTTVAGEEVAEKFADADAFAAAWTRALTILTTPTASGGGGYTAATVVNASWEEIQYALIDHSAEVPPGPDYKTNADILNDKNIDYWWKDGGSPALTLERLLPALFELYYGTPSVVDGLLNGSIDPINEEVYLRKTNGVRFTSDTEFKTIANEALVYLEQGDSTFFYSRLKTDTFDLTWNELQYLLIHYKEIRAGTIPMLDETALTAPGGEADQYWWKDGGKPTGPMVITSLKELVSAACYYNDASDPNLSALDNLQLSQLQGFGIRYDQYGGTYQATDNLNTFIADVTAAVAKLPYTADSVVAVDESNLALELQYLLLNPSASYEKAADLKGSGTTYWWQAADPKLPVTDQLSLVQAAWLTYATDHPVPEALTALDNVDLDLVARRDKGKGGIALRRTSGGDQYKGDATTLKSDLERAIKWFKDNQGATYENLATTVGAYQLQYVVLNATIGADYKTSEADMATDFDKVYWWKAYDSNPNGPEKEEQFVDADEWKAFTDALIKHWSSSDGDTTTLPDLIAAKGDPDYFNKVLMLRVSDGNGTGTLHEFTAGEFLALESRLKTVLSASDRGKNKEFFNKKGNTMILAPTWEEFQYLLLHYAEMGLSNHMPNGTECKNEKTEGNYPWMWKEPGAKVEQFVDADEWKAFADALIKHWSSSAGDTATLPALIAAKGDPDYFNKVLMLRVSDGNGTGTLHEFTAGEFLALESRLKTVLSASDRGKNKEFFNKKGNTMILAPTWEEFQYLLLHYTEMGLSNHMPNGTECKNEKTQDNYGWMWKEEGAKVEYTVTDAVWQEFTDALIKHWSSSAGDTTTLPKLVTLRGDADYFNKILFLRVSDGNGTGTLHEFTAGEFLALESRLKTVLSASDRGKNKEFFNKKGNTMILAPTWEEFQYLLLHYTEMGLSNHMPTKQDCLNEKTQDNYDWMWGPEGKGPQIPPTPKEKDIDESRVTWQAFMDAAIDYVFGWNNAPMDAIAANGVTLLNDDFLLRKNASGDSYTSFNELYDGSTGDVLRDVIALFFQVNRASDFTTNNSSFNVRVPTWYEFQYVIANYSTLNSSRILPAASTIEAEAKANYSWKFETTRGANLSSVKEDDAAAATEQAPSSEDDLPAETETPPAADKPDADAWYERPEVPLGEEVQRPAVSAGPKAPTETPDIAQEAPELTDSASEESLGSSAWEIDDAPLPGDEWELTPAEDVKEPFAIEEEAAELPAAEETEERPATAGEERAELPDLDKETAKEGPPVSEIETEELPAAAEENAEVSAEAKTQSELVSVLFLDPRRWELAIPQKRASIVIV